MNGTTFKMMLGGAICGCFLGIFGGALAGVLYGLLVSDIGCGLDGALIGAVVLAIAGFIYGGILGPPQEANPSAPATAHAHEKPAATDGAERRAYVLAQGPECSTVPENRHLAM